MRILVKILLTVVVLIIGFVHDSQALDELLTEKDKGQDLWADSAYTGEEQEKTIKKYLKLK